jgi:hypothetical protein
MTDFEPYLQGEKTLGQLRQDGVNTRLVRKARRTIEKDGTEHFTLVLADPMPAMKELVRIFGLITVWTPPVEGEKPAAFPLSSHVAW